MQTTLNLLTRDGACYLSFSPHLSPAQYTQLLEISESCATNDELRLRVEAWARAQGLRLSFDEGQEPA